MHSSPTAPMWPDRCRRKKRTRPADRPHRNDCRTLHVGDLLPLRDGQRRIERSGLVIDVRTRIRGMACPMVQLAYRPDPRRPAWIVQQLLYLDLSVLVGKAGNPRPYFRCEPTGQWAECDHHIESPGNLPVCGRRTDRLLLPPLAMIDPGAEFAGQFRCRECLAVRY